MRGVTALGGRGARVVVLSIFAIALIYIVGNSVEKRAPYALGVSETGFYPTPDFDAQPPDEFVSPEVTTLSDEEHPASAKWHYEAMSKIKHKIGAWLPMDKVYGMYGAMRRPPWMDHGDKSTGTPNYNHAPSPSKDGPKQERNVVVGKVSILDDPKNEYIDRAVKTHTVHDKRHGYQHYIMNEPLSSSSAENFAGQVLSALQEEQGKPEPERLEWLYHFPATSIILNSNVPLELFLPPTKNNKTFDATYLVYAGPMHPTSPSPDLSRIVFATKVNQWSVDLFTTLVARTKSASGKQPSSPHSNVITISSLLNLPSELSPQQHALALPPHWLNAWPSDTDSDENADDDYDSSLFTTHQVRRGSFALDLPLPDNSTGTTTPSSPSRKPISSFSLNRVHDEQDDDDGSDDDAAQRRFEQWLVRAESRTPRWEAPLKETWYADQTKAFWDEGGGAAGARLLPSTPSSAFSSLSNWWLRPSQVSPKPAVVVSSFPSASSSLAAATPSDVLAGEYSGAGRGSGSSGSSSSSGGISGISGSSSSSWKAVAELKEEALTLVREMEASVHNSRQQVSEEVRRTTESRCGRARKALSDVEMEYREGHDGESQAQAAKEKLQAVIAALKKVRLF
ncbi:hypothetical protein DIS24_g14 [Lasiodiplodia hormozganensis]|uniref:Glycosyltransferase family 34 protein n=1 Tax=Lasiodiplodia hormozganensis TaxID=869390 RepID=A0AA39Z659_9PEZI|nr:hypothetical protein DIS24_g14 [Lasiodiplodia hormozganensis]